MKKGKLLILGALALAPLTSLTGCNLNKADIGILQFGSFEALENAKLGFLTQLADNGYGNLVIDVKNAQANAANNSTYAANFAGQHKLNLAIATPSATAIKAEQENIDSKTPLLFTAVTDPVDAGLVENMAAPEGFVTGTSDAQPEAALVAQIGLVKAMIPDATKLGIFYCASETNSKVQAEKVKVIAGREGLEFVESTCTSSTDIGAKVLDLAGKVDAIWIPTDNIIANNVGEVQAAIGDKKVLLVMGEEGMVTGGHVSVSIDYFKLGQETGKMAIQILEGKNVSEIPVYLPTIDSCSYVYSSKNLEKAGFDVSSLPTTTTWVDIDK